MAPGVGEAAPRGDWREFSIWRVLKKGRNVMPGIIESEDGGRKNK